MFYDKSQYPALKILEDNSEVIRKEFQSVMKMRMNEWPERDKYTGSWKVFGLYHCGRKLKSFCKCCPETTRVIESIGPVSMAGFSRMSAGTDILPHVDDVKEGLFRIHLGIQIPNGDCGFWVDGQEKRWENGKAFLFDPLKIHKAWNKTSEERVILLLDFESFY